MSHWRFYLSDHYRLILRFSDQKIQIFKKNSIDKDKYASFFKGKNGTILDNSLFANQTKVNDY